MGRGQKPNDSAAAPVVEPETVAVGGGSAEPEAAAVDGGAVSVTAHTEPEAAAVPCPAEIPAAEKPKSAVKKARLILVGAATYADAAAGGTGKAIKNVPFEADRAAARRLLKTGLFKEA
ncbi:MAG: hypothetical protein LBL73_09750 [Synergistaceae bacterium]|jgi:hypothetical protein|nr:hypothetical protein [Synergistaceae bacterium]